MDVWKYEIHFEFWHSSTFCLFAFCAGENDAEENAHVSAALLICRLDGWAHHTLMIFAMQLICNSTIFKSMKFWSEHFEFGVWCLEPQDIIIVHGSATSYTMQHICTNYALCDTASTNPNKIKFSNNILNYTIFNKDVSFEHPIMINNSTTF